MKPMPTRYALGRIYYTEGDKQRAKDAFQAYRKLKSDQYAIAISPKSALLQSANA